MTEKEKLIARLSELGTQLNRDVSTSGTIQELTMRIAELEEELDGDTDSVDGENGEQNSSDSADSADSDFADTEKTKSVVTTTDDRVSVETLATLHVDALHATRNETISIVEPGVIIRVSEQDADELIEKGLAREV
ncbi:MULTISPECIES: DNA-packaging protein FI [Enterobacter cloacae complex]|uniref:DNA-packaging protein n=2 Tax=Pseudomonadota TaxID=1224 RepID=A0AAI9D6P8_9ENTR|nr:MULTISPECIES: DNA-packaging protein FI [Enterobacter cloacae complex]EKS6351459.1 DNA-packaging protein [Enterobacter hormaechei]EKY1472921.1 DNA-packaging protein [Enterobacter hormaechei]ELD4120849.1 DNA-packaging protein [Enterobacter hormaechei]ELO7468610.1 DNA-packaging protein [Enterobacter hormaechei]EMB2809553.1 DNA-packaging protein [Enterobacter hormaechei subsp. hoffmannii]